VQLSDLRFDDHHTAPVIVLHDKGFDGLTGWLEDEIFHHTDDGSFFAPKDKGFTDRFLGRYTHDFCQSVVHDKITRITSELRRETTPGNHLHIEYFEKMLIYIHHR